VIFKAIAIDLWELGACVCVFDLIYIVKLQRIFCELISNSAKVTCAHIGNSIHGLCFTFLCLKRMMGRMVVRT